MKDKHNIYTPSSALYARELGVTLRKTMFVRKNKAQCTWGKRLE